MTMSDGWAKILGSGLIIHAYTRVRWDAVGLGSRSYVDSMRIGFFSLRDARSKLRGLEAVAAWICWCA